MQYLIPIFLAAVAIATALNVFIRRFNMPTVVGYIITGAVIGALFQVDVRGDETLQHVAEFGVVFLMFTIGLEFSFSHLQEMKKEVLVFGGAQVVGTALIIAIAAKFLFGMPVANAITVGSALALSSTAIVLKILNESGQVKTDEGRNAVGILIFQDIAVIPILLMVTIFTTDDKSLSSLLGETALNAAIVVGLLFLAGRFVLGRLFRIVSDTNSKEIYMGSILLTVVGASYFAHHFGFSYSLGGFIAGMMIADTIYKYQVEADLIPFRDLLLGVFFVSVGLQIDAAVVAENVFTIVLLVVSLMSVKAAVLFLILMPWCSTRTSLKSAITLAQLGEFSLVVLSLVLANDMMEPAQVQVLMVTVVLSMIATPFLINNSDAIVRLLSRGKIQATPAESASVIGGHVLLLGYGYFGQLVSRFLDDAKITHVIVTDGTDEYVKARELKKMVVFGDPTDRVLLQQVGIDKAMSTIIALDDVDSVKRASAAIRLIDPSVRVIARVTTDEEKAELESFEHELVLDGNTQTATVIVEQIKRSRLLAKEMSELQFMNELDPDDPHGSIESITSEQKRLLDVISRSFDGMRQRNGIMQIKAFHESFDVLSEIIGKAISDLLAQASLSPGQYEAINVLVDNQEHLARMNDAMDALGRDLALMAEDDATRSLSEIAVEGLDAILLTLKDLAEEYNDMDLELLRNMTSGDRQGLAGIRESYLSAERNLASDSKALLVSATNKMDRLRGLFGHLADNYRRLAEAVPDTAR
jgi:CPA2 family monovalent cation:H+ antiporter-2